MIEIIETAGIIIGTIGIGEIIGTIGTTVIIGITATGTIETAIIEAAAVENLEIAAEATAAAAVIGEIRKNNSN
jgi:hypothetical protein